MGWKTDDELRDIAYALGRKILEMYDRTGVDIPDWPVYPGGAPSPSPRSVFTQSIVADAEDYLSLDPQKVTDEFLRMQKAAQATGLNAEARANVEVAGTRLGANWQGSAALEFAKQMSYMGTFMDQQETYLLFTVQAMGIVYSLAVQSRESFYNLAESTILACDKVIQDQQNNETVAHVGLGIDIVQAGFDLVTMDKLKELTKWGVEQILSGFKSPAEASVDGDQAPQVVDSYTRERDRLRESFEAGLFHLRDWLAMQQNELAGLSLPLLEPLPVCTDVDSPDFSYANFSNENHAPSVFGPRVEREHKKYLEEKQHPDGVIAQRLDGGR